MKSISTSKNIKSFIQNLQIQLTKRLSTKPSNFQQIVETIHAILNINTSQKSNYHQNINSINQPDTLSCKNNDKNSEINKILIRYQENIIDLQNQIAYLKKQRDIEFQMSRRFFKQLMIQKPIELNQSASQQIMSSSKYKHIHFPKPMFLEEKFTQSINFSEVPKIDVDFSEEDLYISQSVYSLTDKSKNQSYNKFTDSLASKIGENDESERGKAILKLRKLQKFVFDRDTKKPSNRKSKNRMYNFEPSPTKEFYKEQNSNLKIVRENLNTHLEMMQKFRQLPSLESLALKEENLKKKEKSMKQLENLLTQRQIKLNKKHSQVLKKEKSLKNN